MLVPRPGADGRVQGRATAALRVAILGAAAPDPVSRVVADERHSVEIDLLDLRCARESAFSHDFTPSVSSYHFNPDETPPPAPASTDPAAAPRAPRSRAPS